VHPSACSALFLALLAAIESALGASMLKTSLANAPVIVLTQLPCQEVRIENRPCCNFISMSRARTTTGSGTKIKKKTREQQPTATTAASQQQFDTHLLATCHSGQKSLSRSQSQSQSSHLATAWCESVLPTSDPDSDSIRHLEHCSK